MRIVSHSHEASTGEGWISEEYWGSITKESKQMKDRQPRTASFLASLNRPYFLFITHHHAVNKSAFSCLPHETEPCASRQFPYVCQALKDPKVSNSKPLTFEIYTLVGETEINRQTDIQYNISDKYNKQK